MAGRGKKAVLVTLALLLSLPFFLFGCAGGGNGGNGESDSPALSENPEATQPGDGEETETDIETDIETAAEPTNVKRVIVLAGQSNAVGHSLAKFLPDAAGKVSAERVEEMKKGYQNITIMFSNNPYKSAAMANAHFVPVNFGFGVKSSNVTFGPEVGVAEYLNKNYPDEKFYIIKCATGATSLFGDWNPDLASEENNLYKQMLTFTKTAIGELEKDGSRAEIIAFCWMQGESDSERGGDFYKDTNFAGYGDLFGKLADGFEETFKENIPEKGLAVIQGGISSYWKKAVQINAAKQTLAKNRSNTYYFQTYDLTWNLENNDNAHFDSAAMVTLGNRFGEYIAKAALS